MGRWSSVTIGPPKHELVIITSYIVNHTAIDPTKNKTAAYQQWQILSTINKKYHPRRQTIIDLLHFIHTLRTSGKEILLFMDSNENKNMNKVFINKLKQQCGLEEAMDVSQNTSTYRRGTSQIDYAMCSPGIRSFIRFISLQDYGTICTSDHKSFILDLDFNHWVGCSIEAAKEQRKRIISSINQKKS